MQSTWMGCEEVSDSVIVDIPLQQVFPSKLNIRSEIGELDGLKESIAEHGLLSPIIVRRMAPSRYEVIAGNRRLRAVSELGLTKVRARVIEAEGKECFEVSLIENVQRQTLDPLDEARAFYSYVSSRARHGLAYGSVTELARRIGKSKEYVSNRIGLLRLPEPIVRQLLNDERLTVSHMEELASLSGNPAAARELAELMTSHRISVRVLEKTVQLIKGGMETSRALFLAKIESDMRLERSPSDSEPDRENEMLRRSKRVLEATLSYLDNTIPELEKEPSVYEYWTENVRLPVHRAIDGIIVCQRRLMRTSVDAAGTPERPRDARAKAD